MEAATSTETKYPSGARCAPSLPNIAGESEREFRSQRANLVEAFAVMSLLLGTLWFVAYPFGVLEKMDEANDASRVLIALLLGFVLVVSPWWHGDSSRSRGLGNPGGLLLGFRRSSFRKRIVLAVLFLAAVSVLTFELYRNATGAARFVLGVEPAMTFRLQQHVGGETCVLLLCAAVSLVWAACVVRYDNLRPALRAAALVLAVLLPPMLLLGWLVNGVDMFLRAKPRQLFFNGLGYMFWGAIQQLLFCSYFGTRLRKGFRPGLAPASRFWKRLGVAALSGLFFALVHIDSWWLVLFTWVLGTFLAWFFMEDRYRNLQVLGAVHGVLGTCVVWLFSEHAPFSIRLRVGPWGMAPRLDVVALLVPGLVIAALALALIALVRLPERTGSTP